MSSHVMTLEVVGLVSAFIDAAEVDDDAAKLAAIIGGCQLLEARAQNTLAGRVPQNVINQAKADARAELGPGW